MDLNFVPSPPTGSHVIQERIQDFIQGGGRSPGLMYDGDAPLSGAKIRDF